MSWDWDRLVEVVRRLKLPPEDYAVGRVGFGLSRDRSSTADRVELLVTETGWRRLKERAWREVGGGVALRSPDWHDLSARLVVLDDVRHEIQEVDGLPVIAVDPAPPARPRSTWRQRLSGATTLVVLTLVIGAITYGFAVFYPTPDADDVVEHLTFRTTRVEATVESSTEVGTCSGVRAYDESPRIELTLSWVEEGDRAVATYRSCGASTDSPQDVWVTDDDVVVSQHAPWLDHFWPLAIPALVPLAVVVVPLVERLRGRWWRRRRS